MPEKRKTILHGDCLKRLRALPSESVDSLVTDPPSGISFMNVHWDSDKGGRDAWIAWLAEILREVHRVLKPGAYGLVWALPRTSHWTAMACEEAGFTVREKFYHLFGSGFPKSHSISKALDRMAGADRIRNLVPTKRGNRPDQAGPIALGATGMRDIAAPVTAAAKQWDGFGTATKPAVEEWVMIQKPVERGLTIAENVLKHGVGALAIDACRIANTGKSTARITNAAIRGGNLVSGRTEHGPMGGGHAAGRWPSHLLLSHSAECVQVGVKPAGTGARKAGAKRRSVGTRPAYGTMTMAYSGVDNYGTETVDAYRCHASCPVAELDRQSGVSKSPPIGAMGGGSASKQVYGKFAGVAHSNGHGDSGGASRFFARFKYQAKPSRRERGEGNVHPTVKSLSLMGWLITLVTPPGGCVLDPFAGSGSTLVAARKGGFRFIGIERERDYVKIARARIKAAAAAEVA